MDFDLKAREEIEKIAKDDPERIETTGRNFSQLLKFYIMGDVLQDQEFQNSCMDAILRICQSERKYPVHHPFVLRVFDNLPSTSPMMKFMVDTWVWARAIGWYKDGIYAAYAASYPSEFWLDVAKGLTLNHRETRKHGYDPWDLNPCLYHNHKADNETRKIDETSTAEHFA